LIADAPDKMRRIPVRLSARGKPKSQRPARARKPKGFSPEFPGHCLALDTIELHRDGMRRALLTLTDLHSRFALALACTTKSSKNAKTLWEMAKAIFPDNPAIVLTDNGSEFAGKFADVIQKDNVIHWHTYPKKPQMNAHCERFNRTIQEEFSNYYDDILFSDLTAYNEKLFHYLHYFNTKRPHHALNLLSPLQFIHKNKKCNISWPNTKTCFFYVEHVKSAVFSKIVSFRGI
jgi:transposase InsO family protein